MTGSGATPSGQEWPCVYSFSDGECIRVGHEHPPAPVQEAGIDSSLIAAHDVPADQTPQEAGSGRHVQSAARNLTSGPGMSSELDGGRQAAVEAVARDVMPCPRCASPLLGRCGRAACPQTEHDHRWTAWRRVVSDFAYDGTEVRTSVATVNRTPVTPGWSRNCACGQIESSTGLLAEVAALSQPGEPT